MTINDKDYKINIIILLMEQEIDTTLVLIDILLEKLEDNVIISILLNGGSNNKLNQIFSKINAIKYYESEINLGVAGGRNFLLNTGECKGSDIVVVLDNDVIVPVDYIRNITSFLLDQKNVGIVGPIIADIDSLNTKFILSNCCIGKHFKKNIINLQSNDIRKHYLPDLKAEHIFHAGMHPNYIYAYFSMLPFFHAISHRFLKCFYRIHQNNHPALALNDKYISLIKNGTKRYSVSNIGGGTQVFKRKLINDIGYLDIKQNPYGLEDVDFSIRSLKAGYTNYIDTKTWLFHPRPIKKNRDELFIISNRFRSYTILAYSVFEKTNSYKHRITKLLIRDTIIDLLHRNRHTISRCKARLQGFQEGKCIIAQA